MAAFAVTVSLATSAAANPYLPCFEEGDVQSARIHELRVMLMVNALKCRQIDPVALRNYGRVLIDRDRDFSFHADRVERQLAARFGPRVGAIAFDDYETMLGNYHSNARQTRTTCGELAAMINLVDRAGPDELESISKLMAQQSVRACPAVVAVNEGFETPVAVAHSVEPPVATPVVAVHVAQAALPQAHEDDFDLAPEETRIARVTPTERFDPSVKPKDTAGNERLAKAIAALDSAAAALREMQEAPAPATE